MTTNTPKPASATKAKKPAGKSTAQGPHVAAQSEIDSNTNPASREPRGNDEQSADKHEPDTNAQGLPVGDSNVERAIAPIAEAATTPEARARVDRALADADVSPKPTMVNGRFVGDKTYNEETGEWELDPNAPAANVRPADIFDRIADAFHHERQRHVIEEIARFAGMTEDNTHSLPEGTPAIKSTASLRVDAGGYGGYAAGGPGPRPVGPGKDGEPVVGEGADTEAKDGQ